MHCLYISNTLHIEFGIIQSSRCWDTAVTCFYGGETHIVVPLVEGCILKPNQPCLLLTPCL